MSPGPVHEGTHGFTHVTPSCEEGREGESSFQKHLRVRTQCLVLGARDT